MGFGTVSLGKLDHLPGNPLAAIGFVYKYFGDFSGIFIIAKGFFNLQADKPYKAARHFSDNYNLAATLCEGLADAFSGRQPWPVEATIQLEQLRCVF